jgi:hypothetical protein
MAYFDGTLHGWNGPNGYERGKPHTKTFCDECAEIELPLKPKGEIGRHWDTDFKWAPIWGGACDKCGKPC